MTKHVDEDNNLIGKAKNAVAVSKIGSKCNGSSYIGTALSGDSRKRLKKSNASPRLLYCEMCPEKIFNHKGI